MSDTFKLGLFIDDGYLNFDPECTDDESLSSWLDNMAPDDMMRGRVRIEVEAQVEWLPNEEGPMLYVGEVQR